MKLPSHRILIASLAYSALSLVGVAGAASEPAPAKGSAGVDSAADAAVARLIALVESGWFNEEDAENAIAAVRQSGATATAVARLARLARKDGGRSRVAGSAIQALRRFGPAAKPAVRTLIRLAQSPDEYVRDAAAYALEEIDSADHIPTRVLVKALDRSEPSDNVQWVFNALARRGKDLLPPARAQLAHADREVRRRTVDALGRIGPAAGPLVPEMIGLLKDPDDFVPAHTARALERIGPAAAEAVPALLEKLGDESCGCDARYALAAIGPAAVPDVLAAVEAGRYEEELWMLGTILVRISDEAAEGLFALSDHLDRSVRRRAARILPFCFLRLPPARVTARVLELLHDQEPSVRRSAIEGLASHQNCLAGISSEPFVQPLCRAAQDPDVQTRRVAVLALGRMYPQPPDAVVAQAAALGDEDEQVRQNVGYHLWWIGPEAAPAVGRLRELLRDATPRQAAGICRILGSIGRKAEPATAQMLPLVEREDADLLAAAAEALGKTTGPDNAPEVARRLAELLDHSDAQVVAAAARGLAHVGPQAARARLKLVRLLEREDPAVVAAAAAAIGAIGAEANQAVPQLVGLLRADSVEVRRQAAQALGRMGSAARRGIGPLCELAADVQAARAYHQIENAADVAVEALVQLGPEAIDRLLVYCGDQPWPVRRTILVCLAAHSSRGIEPLADTLNEESLDFSTARPVTDTLASLGPKAKAAVPALTLALEREPVRASAAFALGCIGPDAKAAVPALTRMLDDKLRWNRVAAAEALDRIGPRDPARIPIFVDALRPDFPCFGDIAALRAYGPQAKAAVAPLKATMQSDNPELRLMAGCALLKIEPGACDPRALVEEARRFRVRRTLDPFEGYYVQFTDWYNSHRRALQQKALWEALGELFEQYAGAPAASNVP